MGRRPVPMHQAIEDYLRARITEARPGDLLPTDKELCDLFHVSRMTARQAVSRLAEAGLVVREPGKGTFVARPRLQREVGALLSFTRQMERQGRVPSSQLLDRTIRRATPAEAAKLGLEPGADLLALRRLRKADGVPTAIELVILPKDRFDWLTAVDLAHDSLHAVLESRGIIPFEGQGTLTAETASREEAHLLEIAAGAPLLVERLVLYDQDGHPIEVGETRYAAQRYALEFHLHRNAIQR